MNVKNIQTVTLKPLEQEEHQEIIDLYWETRDGELINKPSIIAKKYKMSIYYITKIVANYSYIKLDFYCSNCNELKNTTVTSQTHFKTHSKSDIICETCLQTIREERLAKEKKELAKEEEKRQKRIQELSSAITNKNWTNLSNFERELLGKSLEMSFNQIKKHYGDLLGQSKFIYLIRALENIEKQNLLILERGSWNNYITNLYYIKEILAHKEEITFIEKETDNSVGFEKESNTLKFKLTINEHQNHIDSPMFSGIVNFKERIVIEPNVDYIFGHWQRAKDNLYLTLTPLENLEKLPTQKKISSQPISIQKGITDFLNNMGKNNNFE